MGLYSSRIYDYLGDQLQEIERSISVEYAIARVNPHRTCLGILECEEWVTAYISVKKTKPPKKPPSIGDAIKLIAQMGGYLARKNDSPPGPKAIWQGITKLYEILKFNKKLII